MKVANNKVATGVIRLSWFTQRNTLLLLREVKKIAKIT